VASRKHHRTGAPTARPLRYSASLTLVEIRAHVEIQAQQAAMVAFLSQIAREVEEHRRIVAHHIQEVRAARTREAQRMA
jgi:hypothetical protein